MNTQVKSPEIDLDDTLNFTLNLRRQLVDQLTADTTSLLKDKEGMQQTIALLKDLDGTALKIKRLDVDKKGNDNTAEALNVIRAIAETITQDPFKHNTGGVVVSQGADPSKLPEITIIDGETDVGVASNCYDDFMANADKK